MLSIGSVSAIAQFVSRQLSGYTYTFPVPPNVRTIFFCDLWLIPVQSDPLRAVPNRSRPYRHSHIITVIRDLCFTGGINSLAHRYRSRFPSFQTDEQVVYEVPSAMVALVATAVSANLYLVAFILTQCISSMSASMSGVLAGINPLSFQQMHSSMSILVTCTLSVTSLRTGMVGFII